MQTAVAFGIAAAATAATAYAGSMYTQQSVKSPWYTNIKPTFAPPSWVFPVVWTILYAGLTVAFGLSILHDSEGVILLHVLNLVLNVLWCRTFFGDRNLGQALFVLVGNVGVASLLAWLTVSKSVRFLLIPYIAWLCFATALNVGALYKSPGWI